MTAPTAGQAAAGPNVTISVCEVPGHEGHAARITVEDKTSTATFCLPPKHAGFISQALAQFAPEVAAAQKPLADPDCTVCAQVGGPHGVPQTAPTVGDRITKDTKAYVATRAGTFVTGSLVQRHVRVGFARAVTELNQMADDRLIGMPDTKGRYAVPHAPATPGK